MKDNTVQDRKSSQEFCDLPANQQDLTFKDFSSSWDRLYKLPVSTDLLTVLGSYEEGKFTNTAELLSDQNSFPGISVIRYWKNMNYISERRLFENSSVLAVLEEALQMIADRITYEVIVRIYREKKFQLPLAALCEVLVYAIVNRDWSVSKPVEVGLFPDHITILIPGGLSEFMSEAEDLYTSYFLPRNTQLAITFLRLGLLSTLGMRLEGLRVAYSDFPVKPVIKILSDSIFIELPFTDRIYELSLDQNKVLEILYNAGLLKRKQIEEAAGFSQSKTIRLLKDLVEAGRVVKIGSGPSTEYRLP